MSASYDWLIYFYLNNTQPLTKHLSPQFLFIILQTISKELILNHSQRICLPVPFYYLANDFKRTNDDTNVHEDVLALLKKIEYFGEIRMIQLKALRIYDQEYVKTMNMRDKKRKEGQDQEKGNKKKKQFGVDIGSYGMV